MAVAYIALGGNLGDRAQTLSLAIDRLGLLGTVMSRSSFYETEPVEFTQQPWFLNCAVALKTAKTPKQLMAALLRIEQKMGRRRLRKKGPRTIDIDIVLFGKMVMDSAELTVPHPAMHERRFVLEPLAEIAPEERHPLLFKTVRELRDALPSGQTVRRVSTG